MEWIPLLLKSLLKIPAGVGGVNLDSQTLFRVTWKSSLVLLRLTPFIEIVQNLLHKMSWLRNESRINQAELGRFLLGLGTWASNKASHGEKKKKKKKPNGSGFG